MKRSQWASSSGQDNDQDVSSSSKSNSVVDEPAVSEGKYSDVSETTARASKNGQDNHQELPHENPTDLSTGGFQYLEKSSVRLYQAALQGNWQLAKALFDEDSNVFRCRITQANETALHIAVAAERADFVKELVKLMDREDIELANDDGSTALCFAAVSGLVLIAKDMVEKSEKLPLIRCKPSNKDPEKLPLIRYKPSNKDPEITPLYMAALNGRRDMVLYLYPLTPFEELKPEERIDILVATISSDMYDIALTILKKDRTLATMKDSYNVTPLQELAGKPFAIGSRSQLSIWEKCLNNSWFKGMYHTALMQTSAHELVELLWSEVLKLPKDKLSNLLVDKYGAFLFKAAKLGNVEYLIILIRSYPDLIWKVNTKNQSIFHIAVKHRQESVFNLIHEIGAIKAIIAQCVDTKEKNNNNNSSNHNINNSNNSRSDNNNSSNSNMLHLVGRLVPLDRQNIISGAPLQMQRELLWFKEIEKIVPPPYKKMKMKKKETYYTPWELFIKEHEDLKKQGEKWMKDTANYCMLVATLIATVVFAAAFTVPGGNDQESGTPIFLKNNWFMVFFISDAMAMLSSSTSILIFLSILTSRYAEENFLKALPKRLLFGLTTLFISIASMVIAFSATCFLAYNSEMSWVPITIIVFAGVPVTLFVALHFQLWVDIVRSTYLSRFLFRPHRRWLF